MGKMARILICAAAGVMLLTWIFVYFFFFTSAGASFFFKKTVSAYFPSTILWFETDGNLAGGVNLENVEFSDLQGLPPGSMLRIQSLYAKADGFRPDQVSLHIDNARLILPDSDPVVMSLDFENGIVKGNIHTRRMVSDDLSWIPIALPDRITAEIQKLDIDFEGKYDEIIFEGAFDIAFLQREDLVFQESSCVFQLRLKTEDRMRRAGLYGEAVFRGGRLSGRRTALIVLNEGKLIFDGDPLNPRLDIRGNSRVERVKMDIMVTGRFNQPDLYLYSASGLSQNRLLMMLATNQAWTETERSLTGQNLSPGVVKDFLDYFLSGYINGSRMSWFFEQIRRISFDYDAETGQMGIRAGLTDRLEAGYRVEQTRTPQQAGVYKLTGEYQITDRFSVQGEKELRDRVTESGELFSDSTVPDDRVFFKIRQRF